MVNDNRLLILERGREREKERESMFRSEAVRSLIDEEGKEYSCYRTHHAWVQKCEDILGFDKALRMLGFFSLQRSLFLQTNPSWQLDLVTSPADLPRGCGGGPWKQSWHRFLYST